MFLEQSSESYDLLFVVLESMKKWESAEEW